VKLQVPYALICAFLFLFLNCSGDSPTAPQSAGAPPSNATAPVFGFAHDESGVCIPGAVVELLDGPRAGAKVTQSDPCGSVWDVDGGYSFSGLPRDVSVRIRASKAGYRSVDITTVVAARATGANLLLVRE
jgi:hypothetical protein